MTVFSNFGRYGIVGSGGSAAVTFAVDWFILAGGGGGGAGQNGFNGGGGGAGGLRSSYDRGPGGQSPSTPAPGCSREAQLMFIQGETYVITVGAGGNKAPNGRSAGNDGGSSAISGAGITTITSTGGGGGGHGSINPTSSPNPSPIAIIIGRVGGSSGGNGSSDQDADQHIAPGVVSPLQGYAGGAGDVGPGRGGSGGGAGGAGVYVPSRNGNDNDKGLHWDNNMMGSAPSPNPYFWGRGGRTAGPSTTPSANIGEGGNGGHNMPNPGSPVGSGSASHGGSGTVAIRMATPLYTHDGGRDGSGSFPGSHASAYEIGGDTIIRFLLTGTYTA
jgi:hypothetical protein